MNRRDLLHVLGAAAATGALAGLPAQRLLAAGRRLHRRARRGGLQVLDPHQRETVATIAELIIPATDTPGARAARVHEFIDTLLADWSPDDERARFLAGLADVDARARAAFGADFLGATEAQRVTLVTQLDAEAQAARPATPDSRQPPFFQQMKFLTVFGYCTSEVGAKAELHYETIPGAYDGCRPFGGWRANPGDF
ncbi:MAG: hypothetical protein AUH78_21395 [Gemmatimonadetes bacterium 13_1_40CM_4_69_8]|nr:MAG: hypothetical protein AUH45_09365 [Gemmatimonadetes bacterium 13_1_40CM_69_22]OLC70302.1 MAG: hypothetical protein AUH78_21395 [Gemmatimonadetes bacterium 13_1_40CM_4_69_8]